MAGEDNGLDAPMFLLTGVPTMRDDMPQPKPRPVYISTDEHEDGVTKALVYGAVGGVVCSTIAAGTAYGLHMLGWLF